MIHNRVIKALQKLLRVANLVYLIPEAEHLLPQNVKIIFSYRCETKHKSDKKKHVDNEKWKIKFGIHYLASKI